MAALTMVATGISYLVAETALNMTARQLRKWTKHKEQKSIFRKSFF